VRWWFRTDNGSSTQAARPSTWAWLKASVGQHIDSRSFWYALVASKAQHVRVGRREVAVPAGLRQTILWKSWPCRAFRGD